MHVPKRVTKEKKVTPKAFQGIPGIYRADCDLNKLLKKS